MNGGTMHAFVRILFVSLFALGCASTRADEYPSKPIRLIVPFSAGGVVDVSARIVAEKLNERLGWQFVIDNRPGGNGFIAVGLAQKAKSDGYTLLMASMGEFVVNPAIFPTIPYQLQDFTPITMVSNSPLLVVVNSKSPINTFQDLISAAKARPEQIGWASAGNGTANHIAGEWLAMAAGIKLLHVPYKGGAPAGTAVASGDVPIGVVSIPGVLHHLKAGRVKVLGLTTAKRSALAPDWGTAQESGISGVDASIWVGLLAPKGVPKPIVDRIYAEVSKVLELPDLRERFAVTGAEAMKLGPADFEARIKSDAVRYKRVAQSANIKVE
jgi:tripartite-type tricarboxylate transporter receptor subunit TctC